MADNESFFRKVVRFVANPATDWTELNSKPEDARELELEKSELKAMIERKRRNDFVRKREFDVLRRVRREGLSPEQLAALGTSSRMDDSEARGDSQIARPDAGVKAKIDEIEQQMVGDGFGHSGRRPLGSSSTVAGVLLRGHAGQGGRATGHGDAYRATAPASNLSGLGDTQRSRLSTTFNPSTHITQPGHHDDDGLLPALPPLTDMSLPLTAAPAPVQMAAGLTPLSPISSVSAVSFGTGASGSTLDFGNPFAVEVSEVVHDPELDEAVIAFANADFNQCENALRALTGPGGGRAEHADTWLVLFDLFRATGQQQGFEALAVDYAQQFGWSAPQWYSLPKLVADAVNDEPLARAGASTLASQEVGWVCPEHLDVEGVGRLRSQSLQIPLPWVLDWTPLARVDAEAATQLSSLLRAWGAQPLEMRWVGGDRLFTVLQEAAPTGLRDADPAFWLARLDALRLANRADQFDEAAIDYCVTYEVSPPSWEPARCKVRVSSSNPNTRNPAMSVITEMSTSFLESRIDTMHGAPDTAHVELSGQLVGDIGATLRKLDSQLSAAPVVSVSCARLIRVDFIAAGDLLNWVLGKHNEQRVVHFVDAHRLVALFFGAMGINEHAKVQVRKL
jgi:hypothetical protein